MNEMDASSSFGSSIDEFEHMNGDKPDIGAEIQNVANVKRQSSIPSPDDVINGPYEEKKLTKEEPILLKRVKGINKDMDNELSVMWRQNKDNRYLAEANGLYY